MDYFQKLPVPSSFKRDVKNFATPSKTDDDNAKSLAQKNKYSHIQSKVKTFWTPQEMQKAGVKKFFARKGTSSTSTSASSSALNSPESGASKASSIPLRRSLQYHIDGPDFLSKLNELKKGISNRSSSEFNETSGSENTN